ncbi:Lrp/AsnC family transcriptional regulator [Congregibacter sp.]|uniref:Lrp/AsnC family transcriptional regulator n=1 Tax=Congregibacter sp. TaxID=2744308 RepID=UPI003F6DA3D2
MDRIDSLLLTRLQKDASVSVGDLADQVGVSKSACWRRIQKLEESGVIRGRVTLLDPVALGLTLTVFVSVRTNQHNLEWATQFREVVEEIPGVMEVHRLGGDVDYLIKAVVPDMPGYDALYQQLIKADLFDVTASFVMETIKQTSELPLN